MERAAQPLQLDDFVDNFFETNYIGKEEKLPYKKRELFSVLKNKVFLSAFAVFFITDWPHPCPSAVRLVLVQELLSKQAQEIIKRYTKIKKCSRIIGFYYARKIFARALKIASSSSSVLAFPREIRIVPLA